MQDITNINELELGSKTTRLSFEDKQKLVDAFVWLIKEDKKQNPELYQVSQRNSL